MIAIITWSRRSIRSTKVITYSLATNEAYAVAA
jgi:hypothetical protein